MFPSGSVQPYSQSKRPLRLMMKHFLRPQMLTVIVNRGFFFDEDSISRLNET